MQTILSILAVVLVLIALVNGFTVTMAQQCAFAQVCQMLWSVVWVLIAGMLQRAAHRAADARAN